MDSADYTKFIQEFTKANAEIVWAVQPPPFFATFWRQCTEQGYRPKQINVAKACLFSSSMEALGGDLPLGICTENWWSPFHPFKSSLSGETSKEILDAWEMETKKQWTAPIGFKYAAFEIAYNALTRAGSVDNVKLNEALRDTNFECMVGPIKYDEKHVALTPLIGGQWHKGSKWPWELVMLTNKIPPGYQGIPVDQSKMIFPLPPL